MRKIISLVVLLFSVTTVKADTYPASFYWEYIYSSTHFATAKQACDDFAANGMNLYGVIPGAGQQTGYDLVMIYPNLGTCNIYYNGINGNYGNMIYERGYCPYGGSNWSNESFCVGAPSCPSGQLRNQNTGACEALPNSPVPLRNTNTPPDGLCEGNPINTGTGNKFQVETDYTGSGSFPLVFYRSYNSDNAVVSSAFGGSSHWRHNYEYSLSIAGNQITAYRPGGSAYVFNLNNGVWTADADVVLKLVAVSNGFTLTDEENTVETYSGQGQLLSLKDRGGMVQSLAYNNNLLSSVTHSNGRILLFSYDSSNRLAGFTDPAGNSYQYGYDGNGDLVSVKYPDNAKKTYLYNEPGNVGSSFPHALTGIVDENGARFATYKYDANFRAISTEHAGGVGYAGVNYGADFSSVTDALGTVRTTKLKTINGVVRSAGSDQPAGAGCNAASSAITYDANSNVSSKTDFNGNLSCFAYDTSRNLETVRVEGLPSGSACPSNLSGYTPKAGERKITTQWHSNFRSPVQITNANQAITFGYDNAGNLNSKTVLDTASNQSRSVQSTFNNFGEVLTIDGPRSDVQDVTKFGYKPNGDLATITNALGHVTTILGFNGNGQPAQIKDANGLITTIGYNVRGDIITVSEGAELTKYDYDNVRQLKKVTAPDGSYLLYNYDDAHRLINVTDMLGNHINYTLDKNDNKLKSEVFDSKNNLARTRSFAYDPLSRLMKSVGAQKQTQQFAYDANGNNTTAVDGLSNQTTNGFDALNRLATSVDPLGAETKIEKDSLDQVVAVTDPLNHTTSYDKDALGNTFSTQSPDTGVSTKDFDAAGNVITKTDARGITLTYSYDALNRLTQITSPNDKPIILTYDQGQYGLGHLTQMVDASGVTSWTYDIHGRTKSKTYKTGRLSLTVSYGYDAFGRLAKITYPSGKSVVVQYSNGNVSGLTENNQPLISGVQYEPFGGVNSWLMGNGSTVSHEFDLDDHMTGYDLGGNRFRTLSFDAADRIAGFTDSDLNFDQSFNYDAASHLTGFSDPTHSVTYSYDLNGNRAAMQTGKNVKTFNVDPASNKLLSIMEGKQVDKKYQYDLMGNQISDGYTMFGYDDRAKLIKASSIAYVERYLVNGFSQRMAKLRGAERKDRDNDKERETQVGTYFMYDEAGHLIGEYNHEGKSIQETAWLGDMPMAVLTENRHYFIYSDHLNAPRAIANQEGKVVWRWDSDPFGNVIGESERDRDGISVNKGVDEDHDRDGNSFTYNLRFPGQYYDKSTGLNYNVNRYYNPKIGRYTQSDPIGLAGGVNTYGYVNSNPLFIYDKNGLNGEAAVNWAHNQIGKSGYGYFDVSQESQGIRQSVFGFFGFKGPLSAKCNKFVWDSLVNGGDAAGRMPDWRIPSASEWADNNVNISGYYVISPGESLKKGDIISDGHHMGMYDPLPDGTPMTTSAAFPFVAGTGINGGVVNNNWGFRANQSVVVRRCECDR